MHRAALDLNQLGELTPEQQAAYDKLSAQLAEILASQPDCPGDGNIDGKVNGRDLADWDAYSDLAEGESSWYDINLDGVTDKADLAIIRERLGTRCKDQRERSR